MARFRYYHLALLLLIIYLAGLSVLSYPRIDQIFPVDDTYIHLVYAQNLARGMGFSFNEGEPSIGTSSPLWVFLISLFYRLNLDVYAALIVLSFLIFLGCGLLIALLTRELISNMFPSENKTISFLPLCCAALYLFNGNIHWYLFSGMETLLFHFLSLASIYLYSRQGFTMRTGLVLGLLLLTRVSEAPLIAAIGIVDFLRKKKDYAGYGGILLVYLPYLLFSYHLTGSLLPTTAQGKTLTLVDGQFRPLRMISFLFACLRYFFLYNPQILLLLIFVAIFFGWRLLMALKGRKEVNISERVEEHYLFWVIVFWGVFHLGIYTVTFRAMTHHLRYVSGIYPVIILLSGFCWSQWTLRRKGVEKALPILFMTAVLLLTVVNIGFWKEVYYGNVNHIERVYVQAAKWIRDRTSPSERIAAFDIGILKYISNRRILDLGGLVDPKVHPSLVRRDCGEYLQRYDADYILYSRFPDCDFMTGIYLSEYGKKNLLKQKRIAAFSTDYFVTPTIVQSFQLDIFRIEAWLRRNPEGIREQFTAEEARCDFPVHQVYRGEVELLGYDLDRPDLEVVKGVPQAVNLTFYWRKVVSSNNKYFVRTTLSNPATRQVIMEKYHLPTHDIYPMPLWNCQEIVKEHHLIWVPDAAAPGTYDIRVGLVSADELPDAKKNAKGVFSFLKELFGMDFAIFPVDESVGQDALVGKFRIRSSVLEPIRFLNKGSEW